MKKDPTEFRKRFAAWKNGKLPYEAGLPKYEDGDKPITVGDYNVYPSAIGASELNVTTPEVIITGKDRRPSYLRYAAERSTYDPELITNFTGLIPGIGDVQDATMAVDAYNKGDYLSAGLLGAGLLLPNTLEKSGKIIYKGLRNVNVPRWFAHDIVFNPTRMIKDWMRGEYAFTLNGVREMLKRDNIKLNALGDEIKQKIIQDELKQRTLRMNFAKNHFIKNDIVTPLPKDVNIKYQYDTKMNPHFVLGLANNPISIAYYEHPSSSRFKYKWDKLNGYELPIAVGHEFVHRFENDYKFAPHLKTSTDFSGKTGYAVPATGVELVSDHAFHMPSARGLMDIKEVREAFSPTISRYNTNLSRIAEALKLGVDPEFATHPWHSSPAEVIADLRGAIASGMPELDIYKFMYNKHRYDGDKIRHLRNIGY